MVVAFGWQAIKFLGRCQLDRLHDGVSRGATDHESEVVGRAGCGTEGLHLGDEEIEQLIRSQQCLGLLEEHGLVGRTATLGHEEEFVSVAFGRV